MAKTIYVNMPVKQVVVDNGKGYLDLVLNKNRNGKCIRIADRTGENRVHIKLDALSAFIKALEEVRDNGVQTSVEDVEYDAVA